MKNEVFYPNDPSDKLSLPVTSGKKSGDFVLIGDQGLFGVCATDEGKGGNPAGNASVWLAGVFKLPVSTATAADIGDIVYAVAATGVLTPAAGSSPANIPVGWFVQAKGTAAATVRIKLGKV